MMVETAEKEARGPPFYDRCIVTRLVMTLILVE